MSNISVAENSFTQNSASKKPEHQPKYSKPHMIIPIEDMEWALKQSPTVYRLFGECWKSDPFGSRFMPLNTTLKGDNQRKAKKVLKDAGLFEFEVRMKIIGGDRYYETFVINYHGARSSYWKLKDQIDSPAQVDSPDPRTDNPDQIDNPLDRIDNPAPRTDNPDPRTDNPGLTAEMLIQQDFQKASVSSQQHLSNSSKELLRCNEEKQPTAPYGGASSAVMESKEEFLKKQEWRKNAESKLKTMFTCGMCDFAFLEECWADFGLRVLIKVQLRKRPEWGVVVVDEQLVQFDK